MATTSTRTPDITTEIIRASSGEASGIRFSFADGSPGLTLMEHDVNDDISRELRWHGAKQKIGDAGAISRNPETGRSATIADKRAAMLEVRDRLAAGQWNKVRAEGGGGKGLLLSALLRLRPTATEDVMRAWLDGKTDAEQAALRASAEIAPIIEAIKAERARPTDPTIDTAAMLATIPG